MVQLCVFVIAGKSCIPIVNKVSVLVIPIVNYASIVLIQIVYHGSIVFIPIVNHGLNCMHSNSKSWFKLSMSVLQINLAYQ